MNPLTLILSAAWFFLPAYMANMAPVIAIRFKWFEWAHKPVDLGYNFKGKPLFGDNKTFRGFVAGLVFAWITIIFQYIQYERMGFWHDISIIQYDQHSLLLLGFLFGFGALFGDLVESFFKRRLGIKSGAKFIPWDQLDYTLSTLIFLAPIVWPGWLFAVTVCVMNFGLHFGANGLGYLLGWKKVWW